MSKKTILIFICSIILFLGAVAFLLSTINKAPIQNNNNGSILNTSVISNTSLDDTSNTSKSSTNISDTADTSNTSLDLLSNEQVDEIIDNIEHDSIIDFNFYDKDNNELKISNYKDTAIVVLFSDFVDEKQKSIDYLSLLDYYYEKYHSDVEFFCIDKSKLVDASSNIQTFKDGNGIEKYSVANLPEAIFIDSNGNIINRLSSITLENLEANLDLITGNY